jgi:hypothetical protein
LFSPAESAEPRDRRAQMGDGMASLLSPSETAGLSGATLDSRIRRAAGHVSDLTFARIAKRLREDALANELTYERDGQMEPIPVMLRPLLAMNEQLGYVQYVCQRITEALKRLPSLYLNVERIRQIIAVTPTEEAWLRELWTPAHDRNNTVYGRLDAVCDFTAAGWQETLHFMEANLSGVGGISYSPLAENLVMRDIVPTLQAHDPHLKIELPRDQRDLFMRATLAARTAACAWSNRSTPKTASTSKLFWRSTLPNSLASPSCMRIRPSSASRTARSITATPSSTSPTVTTRPAT